MAPNDEVFALRLILNVMLVMRRPQRPSDPASRSFELLFRGMDKEGIPYRPDLQPPPPSERGVEGQINCLPVAHCLPQSLITY